MTSIRSNAELSLTKLLVRLWHDDRGESSFIAMILLTTIAAIGAIVGLVTLRDGIVQEFGDVAVALDALDQSISVTVTMFNDPLDPLDDVICWTVLYADSKSLPDDPDTAPACLSIGQAPTAEGSAMPGPIPGTVP
ncbi:MAG TPA: hypothetical protein PLV92_10400 [Pirellulaceae bacterium]|nr:hypothetical protein [Pirellulaceae bacterium]